MKRVRDERGQPAEAERRPTPPSPTSSPRPGAPRRPPQPKPTCPSASRRRRARQGAAASATCSSSRRKPILMAATAIMRGAGRPAARQGLPGDDRQLAANAGRRPLGRRPLQPSRCRPRSRRTSRRRRVPPRKQRPRPPRRGAAVCRRRAPPRRRSPASPSRRARRTRSRWKTLRRSPKRPPAASAAAEHADLEPMPAAPIAAGGRPCRSRRTPVKAAPGRRPPSRFRPRPVRLPLREAADRQATPRRCSRSARATPKAAASRPTWRRRPNGTRSRPSSGFAPAQYRIGNFYEKGIGVARDIAKAKTWYQMAAEQGNASAMHNLAVLFAMGADGVADNESAARWFIAGGRARRQGQPVQPRHPRRQGRRHAAEPGGILQMVRAGRQDRRQGRRRQARRDRQGAAARSSWRRARAAAELWKPKPLDAEANTVEIPECLAGRQRRRPPAST